MGSIENAELYCPRCDTRLEYAGGLLDWECPNCGHEYETEYDNNGEPYVSDDEEYTYEEIYADPDKNKPQCCKNCSGAYPDCLTSCDIFDD